VTFSQSIAYCHLQPTLSPTNAGVWLRRLASLHFLSFLGRHACQAQTERLSTLYYYSDDVLLLLDVYGSTQCCANHCQAKSGVVKLASRRAITATESEASENTRSRSALLRACVVTRQKSEEV
jgi:hypothetical protein